jgi:hypothetical protein
MATTDEQRLDENWTTIPAGAIPRTDAEMDAAAAWVRRSLSSWGGLWMVYTRRFFSAFERCHWCKRLSVCSVAVNVWGSGVERPACLEHSEYHGRGMDS